MILDQSWQLSKNIEFRPKFTQIWPGRCIKSTSENKRRIQGARLLKSILGSPRVFAGFELGWMHRSGKGANIGAPLFGFTSPFGHPDTELRIQRGGLRPITFCSEWGEALPPQRGLPASGVPKGTRGPEQRGIDFCTFVGSVHPAQLESSRKTH